MAIMRNPYGVGEGNRPPVERYGHCSCCEYPIHWWQYPGSDSPDPDLCEDCDGHEPIEGEDDARRAIRAEFHVEQERKMRKAAAEKAASYAIEVKDSRERVASALRSRDSWRRMVEEMIAEHLPKGTKCACGEQWPCRTVKAAQTFSRNKVKDAMMRMAKREETRAFLEEHAAEDRFPDDDDFDSWR